jgi:mRNA interferase MazF
MVATNYVPDTGDLVKLDFSKGQAGHEQAGWRPALVLSPRGYNSKAGLAVVVPVTSSIKKYPFEVDLPSGLKIGGIILSDAVRSVDWRQRSARYFDKAPAEVIQAVRAKLAALLGLLAP